MFYSDEPIADFNRWDAEREKELEKLPRCIDCGEPIQDDNLFDIDGDLFCMKCMIANFRKSTDNYIKE
jgi:formylmethanofuran dehydrogenase subunit E